MKISESWLRDWVDTDLDSAAIAEVLTMAGLEVDAVEAAGPELPGIIIGKVLSAEPHPDADRLTQCLVESGKNGTVQIVCGATNVRPGMYVPLALPGVELPSGMRVEAKPVRGVASSGMLCSAVELGLAEQSDGLLELDNDARPGQLLREYLALDDTVIDIDLTPNRGDCLSILGIAREISVLTGCRLLRRDVPGAKALHRQRAAVLVQAPQACPRYVARVITALNCNAGTPLWMRERLRRCGIRPISLVVDVTNYVMLELGQPLHAFDRAKLQGHIEVRYARKNEQGELLDGSVARLGPDALVIADQRGPLALAGVMGGIDSAISDDTTEIVLEAAHFTAGAVTGRARRYGLHTDSSHRFERGVDPELPAIASHYASWLLQEYAGGRPGPLNQIDSIKHLPKRDPVALRHAQAQRLLGIELKPAWVGKTLRRIAGKVITAGKGVWMVTPPSYRFDLQRECDLIEELARIDGYHRIEAAPSTSNVTAPVPPEAQVKTERLRQALVDRGYHEVVTYSFVDPDLQGQIDPDEAPVRLNNPIAANMSVMRSSLWSGLIQVLQLNQNRQQQRIRIFEIGKTFHRSRPKVQEITRLAGLVAGPVSPLQWGESTRDADFYDVKGDIAALLALTGQQNNFTFNTLRYPALHPGQAAEIRIAGKQAGVVGRLHPRLQNDLQLDASVFVFEFQLDVLRRGKLPEYREFSRFPAIRRDLAIVVDEMTSVHALETAIRGVAGNVLANLELFDEYRGEHIDFRRKSVAFALTFQHSSRTLKDEEVDDVVENVRAALKERLGAEFRS